MNKKKVRDCAIRLNELRDYGICVMEQHPGKRSATAVFAPLVLLYVIIKSVFSSESYIYESGATAYQCWPPLSLVSVFKITYLFFG